MKHGLRRIREGSSWQTKKIHLQFSMRYRTYTVVIYDNMCWLGSDVKEERSFEFINMA